MLQGERLNMEKKNPAKQEKTLKSRYLSFAMAAAAYMLIAYLPAGDQVLVIDQAVLSDVGRRALGVLVFCLVLWVREPVPFHVTGFIGMLLMLFLKVEAFGDLVKQGFGNETVVFFIGVLTLSAVVTRTGLGKRISVYILSRTGNSTSRILMGFLLVGTLLSMWMTDMAVAAILMPLAVTILREEGVRPGESSFGKALLIACAWGPIIGGIGTPAGAGPNPLAIGFISDIAGIDISFTDWMVYGVPCALLLVVPSWAVLMLFFKPEMSHLKRTKEDMKEDLQKLPPMGRDEKHTVLVFLVTVFLWVSSGWVSSIMGVKISTCVPAILCLCLFYLPGVISISWKEVQADISWDGILLIASGISLGLAVYHAGAAQWLALLLLKGVVGMPALVRIFLIILVISFLKVGLSSNTVTASIIVPIMIVLATTYQLPMMGIVIPACLTLSLAFILVTSTPTSVIPYSAGYFTIGDMAKAGTVLTLVTCVILAGAIYGIGCMTGIY